MKRNIILVLVSVLILTCLFVSTAGAYPDPGIDIPLGASTTTDLGLIKPVWTDEEDILDDLNANSDILEAFANDPLEFDTGTRLETRVNTVLTTWTGSTSVVTVGTIATGVWQGTAIVDAYISNTLTVTGYMQDEDINTFNELNAWVTDQTLIHSGVTTLSSLVSVGTIGTGIWQGTAIADAYISNTLTVTGYMQDADINTFSKLQAWVTDKTLVNEEDIFTIDANWVNTANPWADNEVANNITIDLATLASTLTVADNESTNEDNALVFLPGGDLDGGNLALECDGNLYYNPSTGALTANMHRVNLADESTALNAAWYQITSSVVTGDLTGLRTVIASDAVSGGDAVTGVNVRGVYGQAAVGASGHAGLVQGGLFVADLSDGSCVAYNVHVLCAHYSAGASAVIDGDLYVGYLRRQTREDNAASVSGSDSILAIENEAVQGDGGTVVCAIRIFETNLSGAVVGFTYGVDMSSASIATADIVLQNGEIIENKTDGKITFTGELTGDGGGLTNLPGGYTDLTEFVDQTAWRVFYSDGSGDVTELALGSSGSFLGSNGASSAPTWSVPAGAGDVSKVGTPADSQVGVWTGDGTIEGDASFTYDQSNMQFTGDLGSTGTRITKGWFANLELDNAPTIGGSQIDSDDLSDVASIAMLDENETVSGGWEFNDWVKISASAGVVLLHDTGTNVGHYIVSSDTTESSGYGEFNIWRATGAVDACTIGDHPPIMWAGSDLVAHFPSGIKIGDGAGTPTDITLYKGATIINSTTGIIEFDAELDMNANSIGFTLQTATGDGTTTIDWKLGNKFQFTFGAQNDTLTFTAPTNPGNFMLWVIQDGTGSRLMTWPSIRWPDGTAPTLSTAANAVDIVALVWDGTNWDGSYQTGFATP